jgi:hypothetical protein
MGAALRSFIQGTGIQGSMDDQTFATFWSSLFVIISGILMLPEFFGGEWNPFNGPVNAVKSLAGPAKGKPKKSFTPAEPETDSDMTDEEPSTPTRNKRRKPKKKKTN